MRPAEAGMKSRFSTSPCMRTASSAAVRNVVRARLTSRRDREIGLPASRQIVCAKASLRLSTARAMAWIQSLRWCGGGLDSKACWAPSTACSS